MHRPALLPAVLVAALLLAGCTGADDGPREAFPTPDPSSFASGTCALIAEDVVTLGRAARALGDGPTVPEPAQEDLEVAQKSLQTVAETAEPDIKPLLDAVVTRAGLVRLAYDAERFEPQATEPLAESYAALVDACTGEGGRSSADAATSTATTRAEG